MPYAMFVYLYKHWSLLGNFGLENGQDDMLPPIQAYSNLCNFHSYASIGVNNTLHSCDDAVLSLELPTWWD